MPWVKPVLWCSIDEEPRCSGESSVSGPVGGGAGQGGSPLEDPHHQKWMHPGNMQECDVIVLFWNVLPEFHPGWLELHGFYRPEATVKHFH